MPVQINRIECRESVSNPEIVNDGSHTACKATYPIQAVNDSMATLSIMMPFGVPRIARALEVTRE